MKRNKIQFIIVSPRQKYGGAIVLHVLCRELRLKGYNARIFYKEGISSKDFQGKFFWYRYIKYLFVDFIKVILAFFHICENRSFMNGYIYKPVRLTKRKITPFFNKDNTIVVYPEIEYGNFLNAKYVVHWFLYYNRYKNDAAAFNINDLFFCYRPIFNDALLNPSFLQLYFTNFDWSLYKQNNFGERFGNCYIIRKGSGRKDLPTEFDGIIIDNLPEKEKVKIFNSVKQCISYDTQTFYTSIASICGCQTIVVPEDGKNRSDYLSENEMGYGKAYGFSKDELDYANKTRDLLVQSIKERELRNTEAVEYFLQIIHEKWDF